MKARTKAVPLPPPPVNEVKLIQVLTRLRALLQHGWCQGHLARAGNHRPLENAHDPRAKEFCLLGGLARAAADCCAGDEEYWARHHASWALSDALREEHPNATHKSPEGLLIAFNDTQGGRKPVLALIDRTLARYRK